MRLCILFLIVLLLGLEFGISEARMADPVSSKAPESSKVPGSRRQRLRQKIKGKLKNIKYDPEVVKCFGVCLFSKCSFTGTKNDIICGIKCLGKCSFK